MNPTILSVNPGLAALITGILGIGGITLWWLKRKRWQRCWLPTLRVISLDHKKLPKLRVTVPPIVEFFCYLLSFSAVLFFTFKPKSKVLSPFDPTQSRIHIYLDLSPSVSGKISIEEYEIKVKELISGLEDHGRITISRSDSAKILEWKTGSDEVNKLENLRFHRSGLKLGESIKEISSYLGDIDRLFIFSDGDKFTWEDFNWQYLQNKIDIKFVNLSSKPIRRNYYIRSVNETSLPSDKNQEWSVTVARTTKSHGANGVVEALFQGELLGRKKWYFKESDTRVNIKVSWEEKKIIGYQDNKKDHIMWRLIVNDDDAIIEDNFFRTPMQDQRKNILMVAEPPGETFLEDPMHHLRISLELLGFKIKRLDQIASVDSHFLSYPFWIILAGNSHLIDDFCPYRFFQNKNKKRRLNHHPIIWLIPYKLQTNYQVICQCFATLALNNNEQNRPPFCENIQDKDQWTGVLQSLGAKQVGGEIGNSLNALAWQFRNDRSGAEVLAFTLPLKPNNNGTGLGYVDLPLITNQLLQWHGLKGADSLKMETWPRLTSINQNADSEFSEISNVPVGESLQNLMDEEDLPEKLEKAGFQLDERLTTRSDQGDPIPWLQLCLALIGVSMLIEVTIFGMRILKGRLYGWLIFILMPLGIDKPVYGTVSIATVGYSFSNSTAVLSREVALRTSIVLGEEIFHFSSWSDEAISHPWIWTSDITAMKDRKGQLSTKVSAWLRRGGFLIVENVRSLPELKTLTKDLKSGFNDGRWIPIPPDHELMRSFHLLDSLPQCETIVWHGYHFDGRLSILAIPFQFLSSLLSDVQIHKCGKVLSFERKVRVFINILMVALTTDYKKDQIHLPDILKRIR